MEFTMALIPYVVESGPEGERTYDIYSRLLEDRIVFLGSSVTSEVSNSIIAQLLLLDQKDHVSDICLYINSPGGSVTAGLAILDTMNYIKADVRTVCVGEACSMAAVLLSAGAKGKRSCLPNSKVMIHQPRTSENDTMTVTEHEIELKEMKKIKKKLIDLLAVSTGQSYKKVWKDCELDKWFEPEDAKQYGLIDEIIYKKPN